VKTDKHGFEVEKAAVDKSRQGMFVRGKSDVFQGDGLNLEWATAISFASLERIDWVTLLDQNSQTQGFINAKTSGYTSGIGFKGDQRGYGCRLLGNRGRGLDRRKGFESSGRKIRGQKEDAAQEKSKCQGTAGGVNVKAGRRRHNNQAAAGNSKGKKIRRRERGDAQPGERLLCLLGAFGL
jgi:hypothetical protein